MLPGKYCMYICGGNLMRSLDEIILSLLMAIVNDIQNL